jgi:amino-acid N-acetyltransferase
MPEIMMNILEEPSITEVIGLLKKSDLPFEDITPELLKSFYAYRNRNGIVGIVGLEIYEDCALLRSLAVESYERGKGYGKSLIGYAENSAKEKNVKSIYLLTTTAQKFFERNGYVCIDRKEAPEAIKKTKEFSAICPSSSVFMVKHIF